MKAFKSTWFPPVIIDTSDDNVRVRSGLWPSEMPFWVVLRASEECSLFDLMSSQGEIMYEARLREDERTYLRNSLVGTFGMLPW